MTEPSLSIPLTEDEQKLLDEIELDASAVDHEVWKRNGDRVVPLFHSLVDRNAIPDHRRRYFTDPEYNIGGHGKSRITVFEGNGTAGEDILRHAHFLKFLRYFLHGPELPATIVKQFTQAVEACGMVTSGDITPLSQLARKLAREHRLEPHETSDEFFKLALEAGMDVSDADAVRRAVQQIKYR